MIQNHQKPNKKMNHINLHRARAKIEDILIIKRNKKLINNESLRIISWNINGNLNTNTNKYPIFINEIKNAAHIYAFQETIGTKFTGYQPQNEQTYGLLLDADKITDDRYGITSIYINNNIIKNYVPIPIPCSLYDGANGTSRIYATSTSIILPHTNICIINIYRPPITTIHGTKQHMKQLQNVINGSKSLLEEIIYYGDLNIWHEAWGLEENRLNVF